MRAVQRKKGVLRRLLGQGPELDFRHIVGERQRRTAVPLGLRPDTVYQESGEIELSPGQMMVMLTDGFEEGVSAKEEMFGAERVLSYLKEHRHESAEHIVMGLYNAFRAFTGHAPQLDDLTTIVIKVC